MPGSNSRPNVSEGYEVPTELPGSTGGGEYVLSQNWGQYYTVGNMLPLKIILVLVVEASSLWCYDVPGTVEGIEQAYIYIYIYIYMSSR